jgi:hypothetical protein
MSPACDSEGVVSLWAEYSLSDPSLDSLDIGEAGSGVEGNTPGVIIMEKRKTNFFGLIGI